MENSALKIHNLFLLYPSQVTKRWDPNNENNKGTNGHETIGIGRLRKVSNEDDVVNV